MRNSRRHKTCSRKYGPTFAGRSPNFPSSENGMHAKGSVPVVDDEFGPRESLRMILNRIYEVHAVDNVEDAIYFICREKVDLVTLDLRMPGLSGIDVVREIKIV